MQSKIFCPQHACRKKSLKNFWWKITCTNWLFRFSIVTASSRVENGSKVREKWARTADTIDSRTEIWIQRARPFNKFSIQHPLRAAWQDNNRSAQKLCNREFSIRIANEANQSPINCCWNLSIAINKHRSNSESTSLVVSRFDSWIIEVRSMENKQKKEKHFSLILIAIDFLNQATRSTTQHFSKSSFSLRFCRTELMSR